MKLTRTRERHAWCDECTWNTSDYSVVTGGDDPVLAAAHLHCAETGHEVIAQRVTFIRYKRDASDASDASDA